MRKISFIAVHCTAGNEKQTIADLTAEFRRLGWKNPGYHYVVMRDGKVVEMLPVEKVSNGVKHWNHCLVNVAYIGGKDGTDNRTQEQKDAMRKLLRLLKTKFPDAIIKGHRDFSPDTNHNGKVDRWEWTKLCPCFEAMEEYKDL